TLSGNPLACAAGLATLRALDDDAYAKVDAAARAVSEAATSALTAAGVPHRLQTAGNLFSIFFTDRQVKNFADAQTQNTAAYKAFSHARLHQGVYLPPSAYEAWFLSASHDDEALGRVVDAVPAAAKAAAAVL